MFIILLVKLDNQRFLKKKKIIEIWTFMNAFKLIIFVFHNQKKTLNYPTFHNGVIEHTLNQHRIK